MDHIAKSEQTALEKDSSLNVKIFKQMMKKDRQMNDEAQEVSQASCYSAEGEGSEDSVHCPF
jgi:hypothetical protein